jgi:hypothetical protein
MGALMKLFEPLCSPHSFDSKGPPFLLLNARSSKIRTKVLVDEKHLFITLNLSYKLIRNVSQQNIDAVDFRVECTLRSVLCLGEREEVFMKNEGDKTRNILSHKSRALVLEKMNCEQYRNMSVLIIDTETNKSINRLDFSSPRTKEFNVKRRSRNIMSPRRRRRRRLRGHEVGDICTMSCSVPGFCVLS